jgi:aminopeptidase N
VAEVLAATALGSGEVAALRAAGEAYATGPFAAHRELRWLVLAGRCRVGDARGADVDRLGAEDRGDRGRRGALRAWASWPTPAAKADAWTRATGDGVSLAERQAVLDGWAAPGQDDLRRPYEERFAAALTAIERSSGAESALAFARTAFPRRPADRAVRVAEARRLVEEGSVGDAVQRAVIEQLALLERRERARALSP